MVRKIKIAAVQMAGQPASVGDRLAHAEEFVVEAAAGGAQLVVLPEVFNTGYEYADENYHRAESMDGPTITWMKDTAARLDIHLAGTLFVLDEEDIYNSMVIVAPDGRLWRYDKMFPWAWERATFREGGGITVADTDLGRLGMLVCWDAMHADLWARYAGKIDAMIVCSCPPQPHRITVCFPDGQQLAAADASPLIRQMSHDADETFGALLRRQAAHLGVPVVNTTAFGEFSSAIPAPLPALVGYTLFKPEFWSFLRQADQIKIASTYFTETYIADAAGNVLAQVPEGEGRVLTAVELADERPPVVAPLSYGLSPLTYILFDWLLPALLVPVYRRGVRRTYGSQMAPVSPQTKLWLVVLMLFSGLGALLGRSGRRR
ncbi:carbon-nitrogen hydrolase family protein [Chloroflexota bacterium]